MSNTTKYASFWALYLLFTGLSSKAQQLKLGNHPSSQTQSAVLELESRNQGLLLTRVPDTALINAFDPPDGTIIYFTDGREVEPYGRNAGIFQRVNGAWLNVMLSIDTAVDHSQSAIKFTRENGKLVLHLPNATTNLRGVVSGGYQTFSGRKTFHDSVRIKNLHPGSIVFIRGGDDTLNHVLTENNGHLFWDNIRERLGIGTNLPASGLDVNSHFKLGAEGSILANIIKDTFVVSNPVQIMMKEEQLFSISSSGIKAGGSVVVSPAGALPEGLVIAYGYTSAGVVYFKIRNVKDASVTVPANTTFYVTVVQ